MLGGSARLALPGRRAAGGLRRASRRSEGRSPHRIPPRRLQRVPGTGGVLLRRPGGEESTVPPALLTRARDLVVTQSSPWHAPVWRWGTGAAPAACLVLAVSLEMRQAGAPPLPGAPKGVQAPAAGTIPAVRQPDVPAVVSAPPLPAAPPPVAPPPSASRRSAAALRPWS